MEVYYSIARTHFRCHLVEVQPKASIRRQSNKMLSTKALRIRRMMKEIMIKEMRTRLFK